MRKLTMVNSVELTNEKLPVHVPLSCAVCGESRMHGSNGGVGETCRKVTRPDPTHSLQHRDSRPRSAVARVRRAWTATESPVAIGDGLAPMPPCRCVDPRDGARR